MTFHLCCITGTKILCLFSTDVRLIIQMHFWMRDSSCASSYEQHLGHHRQAHIWMGLALGLRDGSCSPVPVPFIIIIIIILLRSCCDRPQPWVTAAHSQLRVYHITASKYAAAGESARMTGKSSSSRCSLTKILFKHAWTSPAAAGGLFLWKTVRLPASWYPTRYITHWKSQSPAPSSMEACRPSHRVIQPRLLV